MRILNSLTSRCCRFGDVSPRDWLAKQDQATLFRDLTGWMEQKTSLTVDLLLPKYKASYEDSLLEELKALGMGIDLNGATADFTKLSEDGSKGFSSRKSSTKPLSSG
jgi:serine protease inhibitor